MPFCCPITRATDTHTSSRTATRSGPPSRRRRLRLAGQQCQPQPGGWPAGPAAAAGQAAGSPGQPGNELNPWIGAAQGWIRVAFPDCRILEADDVQHRPISAERSRSGGIVQGRDRRPIRGAPALPELRQGRARMAVARRLPPTRIASVESCTSRRARSRSPRPPGRIRCLQKNPSPRRAALSDSADRPFCDWAALAPLP
jgi:hypothetical protein